MNSRDSPEVEERVDERVVTVVLVDDRLDRVLDDELEDDDRVLEPECEEPVELDDEDMLKDDRSR